MGKRIVFYWDQKFEDDTQDAFTFMNGKRAEGQRFTSLSQWMMQELSPFIIQGVEDYARLRKQGVELEPLPSQKEDETKRMNGDVKHVLMFGGRTYEFLRETAAGKNHLGLEQMRALGQRVGKPPFASVAEWVKAVCEERSLTIQRTLNEDIIQKETEQSQKDLEEELSEEVAPKK